MFIIKFWQTRYGDCPKCKVQTMHQWGNLMEHQGGHLELVRMAKKCDECGTISDMHGNIITDVREVK